MPTAFIPWQRIGCYIVALVTAIFLIPYFLHLATSTDSLLHIFPFVLKYVAYSAIPSGVMGFMYVLIFNRNTPISGYSTAIAAIVISLLSPFGTRMLITGKFAPEWREHLYTAAAIYVSAAIYFALVRRMEQKKYPVKA